VIHSYRIWDGGQLIVCGAFWPGAQDGAEPPDWWFNPDPITGGAPIVDTRTVAAASGGEEGA
jgi:hypothetical protein